MSAPVGAPSGSGIVQPVGSSNATDAGVDGVLPRGKEAHVAPLADRRADRVAGLEHQGCFTAGEQVRRGGQANRASANDGDGQRVTRGSHDLRRAPESCS